ITAPATTEPVSARAIRQAGPVSSREPCTCSRPGRPSRCWSAARALSAIRRTRRRRPPPRRAAGGPDMSPAYTSLDQINTRALLTELSATLGRAATLDDISDAELDRIAALGFDWVWLLSVWRTGSAGERISRAPPGWRHEVEAPLADPAERHLAGSGFAIPGYTA